MAVVLDVSDQSARIGFQPGRELGGAVARQRETGIVTLDGVRWAKAVSGPLHGKTPTAVSQVLAPGDVIYADPLFKDGRPVDGQYRLRQLPEVSGAMVVMDDRIISARDAQKVGLLGRFGRPERVRSWTYEFDPSGLELLRRAIEHVAAQRPAESATA